MLLDGSRPKLRHTASPPSIHRSVFLCVFASSCLLFCGVAFAQVPAPEQFLGFRVGSEGKVARWDRIVEYMKLAAAHSDRVRFQELGKSTGGNPFVMMVISSPANLGRLEHYREVNRRLFDPRTISSQAEADKLIDEARLIVLVTCSIHAPEIGATQMALEAVHRLATDNSPRTRHVLDNVIFLLVPSLNPDGQILVTDWYNKTAGTPHENAPLPWLHHPYTGHDNNRDAYMFTQKETRLIGEVLYRQWQPAVWLDEHQMGPAGPRIFVMPAADPINPNVDPLIYRNAGLLGFAQAAALERAGKEGIMHGDMYTYWWEGAMAWAGWWHNMVGILTEVASARVATTVEQQRAEPGRKPAADARRPSPPDDGRPLPPPTDTLSRAAYPRPWLGGKWSLRDIVDYEMIATFALLETGASLRTQLLEGLVSVGKRQIELGRKGNPFAIVVPREQPDRPTVVKLLEALDRGGVEIHQASAPFGAGGKVYPAGTYVIRMDQPFRAYAKDLLEPQVYPTVAAASAQGPRAPYDVAGWSLGMQMGVETVFVKEPFTAQLEKLDAIDLAPGGVSGAGPILVLRHEPNNSLVAVNRLLKEGHTVEWLLEPARAAGRNFASGAIVVRGGAQAGKSAAAHARSLGIDAYAARDVPSVPRLRIRAPRSALYQPWGGAADEGWTRWVLEANEFPYTTVHPDDVRKGGLASRFDAFILPDMPPGLALSGLTAHNVPQEYRGGMEESGCKALRAFVEQGGTAIALGQSCALVTERFALPFRDALRGVKREDFFCPGSILRVLIDAAHPIGFGMPEEANGYFANSMALEMIPSSSAPQSAVVARYPSGDLLRSGWLQGESRLHNRIAAAEVRLGKGRIVLLPLRVQHRAQSHGTFKLLFNAILTSAVDSVPLP
jgi:hypothetical protein